MVPAALLLSACKVDTTVDLSVRADGTGRVTVTAVADKELVERTPGLAADLRFDDAVKAGWVNDSVSTPSAGGLQVVLHHDFTSVEQATAILRSINGASGPLHDLTVLRTGTTDEVVTSLSGTLRIDGGLDAFADPKALAAIGGTPYANDIAAAHLKPADVVSITFVAHLPGNAAATTFSVPLDGTPLDVATHSRLTGGASSNWGVLATVLLVALVVWCLAAAGFVGWVARERRRRALRRVTVD